VAIVLGVFCQNFPSKHFRVVESLFKKCIVINLKILYVFGHLENDLSVTVLCGDFAKALYTKAKYFIKCKQVQKYLTI